MAKFKKGLQEQPIEGRGREWCVGWCNMAKMQIKMAITCGKLQYISQPDMHLIMGEGGWGSPPPPPYCTEGELDFLVLYLQIRKYVFLYFLQLSRPQICNEVLELMKRIFQI
jgi:hypothetical protein